MKTSFVLACLLFFLQPDPPLLVLDKNLKKPIHSATAFTTAQYLQHCFPIYASEAEAIVAATDKVVKLIEKELVCHRMDTVATAHTLFLVKQDCAPNPTYSVTVITTIEESHTSYGFKIVREEENRRKAQQKLLDFATYLAQ
jgi:hypothetical protein